jgi:intracellular multiplication protein IcmP
VPLELPMFAEAFYPEEWMAYHRIRVVNGVPDRDQIRRALLIQLGDRFDGIDNLPEHLYCLLSAFALKGARKRKECDELLGEIAKCWSHEAGFVPSSQVKSAAARALNDPKVVEPLLEVMNRHAYVATAFLAALAWARQRGGVLAPAQFVWLRGEHREMWYPLSNMGRRAFHVEASGAMAHYQAEVEASRALTMPRLDAAVVSIVQYISETRARIPEIEGGERDQTKKLAAGKPEKMLPKPAKH